MVDDAAKFVTKEGHDTYDCIVVDSSDPVGTCWTSKNTHFTPYYTTIYYIFHYYFLIPPK